MRATCSSARLARASFVAAVASAVARSSRSGVRQLGGALRVGGGSGAIGRRLLYRRAAETAGLRRSATLLELDGDRLQMRARRLQLRAHDRRPCEPAAQLRRPALGFRQCLHLRGQLGEVGVGQAGKHGVGCSDRLGQRLLCRLMTGALRACRIPCAARRGVLLLGRREHARQLPGPSVGRLRSGDCARGPLERDIEFGAAVLKDVDERLAEILPARGAGVVGVELPGARHRVFVAATPRRRVSVLRRAAAAATSAASAAAERANTTSASSGSSISGGAGAAAS